MKCPRDMSEMNTKRHEAGFEIDLCPTCDGVWLDKGELEAVQGKVENEVELGKLEPPKDFDFSFSKKQQASLATIGCPRCGKKMDVREYAGWSEILVDVCDGGCGLWLDRNELKALEVFFESNRKLGHREKAGDAAMWSTLVDLFGG